MTRKKEEMLDPVLEFVLCEEASDPAIVAAEDVAAFDRAIALGKKKLAQRTLQKAQREAAGYKPRKVTSLDIERARREVKLAQSDKSQITMAARFGDGTMDDDMDAVLEDLAELADDE